MTHTETINGKQVIFETVQVAERIEHSTEYFMDGYTGDQFTHTAIGSFAIGSDDFEEISYIEKVEGENSKRLKSLFITYFDGCYGVDAELNTPNTFAMGVCKLEYKENELTVHLRRPGLLIGKGGRTIDALAKRLDCKIGIVEVNLQK